MNLMNWKWQLSITFMKILLWNCASDPFTWMLIFYFLSVISFYFYLWFCWYIIWYNTIGLLLGDHLIDPLCFFLLHCRFGPIEYKGPFVAPYVESFILRVITPLTYLPSRATLKDFLSYHEVLFVFGTGKLTEKMQSLSVMKVSNISFLIKTWKFNCCWIVYINCVLHRCSAGVSHVLLASRGGFLPV